MRVRAKVRCVSVQEFETTKLVNMVAVTGNNRENADFAKYTPSGNFTLGVDNETPAANFYKPGREYYVLFEEAPADSNGPWATAAGSGE